MVVARVAAQRQWVACGLAGGFQQLGAQLRGQKVIGQALVDQQGQAFCALLGHQGHRIVRLPRAAVGAQVGGKRFFAPRHLAGGHDGRKGRHAGVAPRVFQRQGQGPMAPHRVAADGAVRAGGKVRFDQRGQLLHHIVFHAVVRSPGRLGGVQVKPGPLPQVVSGIVGHIGAARAGVRCHQDEAVLRCAVLRPGFGDEVLLSTGQAREPIQHRAALPRQRLGRQVHAKAHVAVQAAAGVLPHLLLPAKAGVVFQLLQAHATVSLDVGA